MGAKDGKKKGPRTQKKEKKKRKTMHMLWGTKNNFADQKVLAGRKKSNHKEETPTREKMGVKTFGERNEKRFRAQREERKNLKK